LTQYLGPFMRNSDRAFPSILEVFLPTHLWFPLRVSVPSLSYPPPFTSPLSPPLLVLFRTIAAPFPPAVDQSTGTTPRSFRTPGIPFPFFSVPNFSPSPECFSPPLVPFPPPQIDSIIFCDGPWAPFIAFFHRFRNPRGSFLKLVFGGVPRCSSVLFCLGVKSRIASCVDYSQIVSHWFLSFPSLPPPS